MVLRLLSLNIPIDLKHGSAGQNSWRKWSHTFCIWEGCAISSLGRKGSPALAFYENYHCDLPYTSCFQLFNKVNWYSLRNLQFVFWSNTHDASSSMGSGSLDTKSIKYSCFLQFFLFCSKVEYWRRYLLYFPLLNATVPASIMTFIAVLPLPASYQLSSAFLS